MTEPATDTAKKRRLFGGLLLLWLLPAIQTGLYMKVFRSQPPGYEATLPRPTLSATGLWASSYQPALEAYATQHIGFRKWLMRARNQLVFSVFDEPHSPVVVGRQGVLFEEEPLRAALGLGHALTPTEIQTRVRCLRALQDTLARRGKLLLFVIAPSKASLYPEYWPDSAQHASRRTTNYERLRGPLQASGLTARPGHCVPKLEAQQPLSAVSVGRHSLERLRRTASRRYAAPLFQRPQPL